MALHELVSPIGVLHRVADERLLTFCAQHGLERPDNIARLAQGDSKYHYSQEWQALHHVRWLRFVDKKTLKPINGVAMQPVLGSTGYFLEHVARNNPNMVDVTGRVIFKDAEFSRLLGKKPPPHYKGWARATITLDEARKYFGHVSTTGAQDVSMPQAHLQVALRTSHHRRHRRRPRRPLATFAPRSPARCERT